MPAGFSAWTDDGYVQITDAYSNLTFKQKITVSTPGGSGLANAGVNGTFSVTSASSPVLAFQTTGYVTIDQVTVSGTTWTYRILHTGTSVVVYVFDYPTNATPVGNFGLQVYKANGELAFDSSMKYARIDLAQAPSGTFPTWNNVWPPNTLQTTSVIANSGRTYAVALSYVRSGSIIVASDDTTEQYQILVDAVSINGATATLAMMRTNGMWWTDRGSGPSFGYYRQSAPPPILFFDVTGY